MMITYIWLLELNTNKLAHAVKLQELQQGRMVHILVLSMFHSLHTDAVIKN